jgi:hypothetical protein
VVELCKYHQLDNIRVSMAKERKRLINEDVLAEASIATGTLITGAVVFKSSQRIPYICLTVYGPKAFY